MDKIIFCYKCEQQLVAPTIIGRNWECPHCYSDLHCCKSCRFYDSSAYNECREPVAERIVDKEKANFCDYFKLTMGRRQNQQEQKNGREALIKAANDLFKD